MGFTWAPKYVEQLEHLYGFWAVVLPTCEVQVGVQVFHSQVARDISFKVFALPG